MRFALGERLGIKVYERELSSAKRLVAKMDKQRRKYYESYTGQKWGDPHNYDLNIDTGEVSISQAVDLIVSRF